MRKSKTAVVKREEFDEKVSEMYALMEPQFRDPDEPTKSMLRTYCVVCVQINDLNDEIMSQGYMVDDGKGGKKENPAVNTVHKLNADKARYYAPLKRALREQEGAEEDDRFESDDEFMGL